MQSEQIAGNPTHLPSLSLRTGEIVRVRNPVTQLLNFTKLGAEALAPIVEAREVPNDNVLVVQTGTVESMDEVVFLPYALNGVADSASRGWMEERKPPLFLRILSPDRLDQRHFEAGEQSKEHHPHRKALQVREGHQAGDPPASYDETTRMAVGLKHELKDARVRAQQMTLGERLIAVLYCRVSVMLRGGSGTEDTDHLIGRRGTNN